MMDKWTQLNKQQLYTASVQGMGEITTRFYYVEETIVADGGVRLIRLI